jgi:hypothetical protein
MDVAGAELKMLRLRLAGLGAQLDGEWSAILDEQRHLDRDTTESAYWHAGYYQALADVIELIAPARSIADTSDTSSLLQVAG